MDVKIKAQSSRSKRVSILLDMRHSPSHSGSALTHVARGDVAHSDSWHVLRAHGDLNSSPCLILLLPLCYIAVIHSSLGVLFQRKIKINKITHSVWSLLKLWGYKQKREDLSWWCIREPRPPVIGSSIRLPRSD